MPLNEPSRALLATAACRRWQLPIKREIYFLKWPGGFQPLLQALADRQMRRALLILWD
jgi:hypothetical protein